MSPAEESAFLFARSKTGRDAFALFKKDAGDGDDVKARFRTLPLLLDPDLQRGCRAALEEAKGSRVDASTPLPLTIWSGAYQIDGGQMFDGTIGDFVELLEERAQIVAAKREGLVVEPTSTTDGRRTNENTTAVHALFLDCDGAGEWDALLTDLELFDYAFVAYQSGGWSPTTPKWRIVIPLQEPHDTQSEARQTAWKLFYRQARIVFGAVGRLLGVGFDSATDTPCCPWFLTEKRSVSDPIRRVVWRAGHCLDAVALALALPVVEETPAAAPMVRTHQDADALPDERLEEIVSALAIITSSVPTNRRDLYLSLPAVLLDRGLCAKDVLTVCENVSARYPRSHPDKHADNIHNIKTTISKWERDGHVTRIKTLNEVVPHVARVVDAVVPDPERTEFFDLARRLARRDASAPPPPDGGDDGEAPAWQMPVDLRTLRDFTVKMRRKKRKGEGAKDAVHWILLDRLLKKKTLASPLERDSETLLGREDALYRLVGLLAFRFPKNTPVEIVIELLRPSVNLTLEADESADKWLKLAGRWYVMSLAARLEMDAKKEAERETDRQQRIREAKRCVL